MQTSKGYAVVCRTCPRFCSLFVESCHFAKLAAAVLLDSFLSRTSSFLYSENHRFWSALFEKNLAVTLLIPWPQEKLTQTERETERERERDTSSRKLHLTLIHTSALPTESI